MTDIFSLTGNSTPCNDLTALQIAAGYVTWLNILKIFALAVGAGSIIFLFGRSIMKIVEAFKVVPFVAVESIGYAATAALLVGPSFIPFGHATSWMVIAGCFLFTGLLPLSTKLRKKKGDNTVYAFIVMIVSGIAAFHYGESVAGFLSVAALMAFLGFSVLVTPMAYMIGFDDEAAVSRAGAAGLLVCCALGMEHAFVPGGLTQLDVFRTGMSWLGPFVFALALLIKSSRWSMNDKGNYLIAQIVAVAGLSAMIYFGGILHIDALLNVGTAFLILYVLEKPVEVPHKSLTSLAVTGLSVSCMVGAGVYWAQANPEIVARWLPLLAR